MLTEKAISYIEIKRLMFMKTKLGDKRMVLQSLIKSYSSQKSMLNEVLELNGLIEEVNLEIKRRWDVIDG